MYVCVWVGGCWVVYVVVCMFVLCVVLCWWLDGSVRGCAGRLLSAATAAVSATGRCQIVVVFAGICSRPCDRLVRGWLSIS